jgi:hypothetical protein
VKNGVSKEAGKVNRGPQNYAFPAPPSTAVGVAQVLTANGRLDWKSPSGQPLKDRQTGI